MLFRSRKPVICALDVGHAEEPDQRGAYNRRSWVSEWAFNDHLATMIADRAPDLVTVVNRGVHPSAYRDLPAKINKLEPRFIISLHCNAYNEEVSGTEVLYYRSSDRGRRIASCLLGHLLNALNLRNRGIKPIEVEDRGGYLLAHTKAPCVIAEPFFIDHDEDLAVAVGAKDALADAYVAAVKEMAAT